MMPYTSYPMYAMYMNERRRKELERDAGDGDCALQHQANQKSSLAFAPVLAALGRQLVRLGENLQAENSATLEHEL